LDSGAADPEGLRQLQRGVCDFALDRFDGDAEQSCELGDTAGDAIGEDALGASDQFMARRRFQSSPSAPLRTIGGSSRRHSSRAKSFKSRPKRVRRARAPDDRCRSVTYVTAPLGEA
jgi:hypothetical protein